MFVREMVKASHEDTKNVKQTAPLPSRSFAVTLLAAQRLAADPVPVRRTQGTFHGFLVLKTLEGRTLAIGGQPVSSNFIAPRYGSNLAGSHNTASKRYWLKFTCTYS